MKDDSGQTARNRFAQSILDNIEIVGTPTFRHFSSVSLPYLSRCRQHTISYWDCYYRGAISRVPLTTNGVQGRGFKSRRPDCYNRKSDTL
jgi:hypothetical protein